MRKAFIAVVIGGFAASAILATEGLTATWGQCSPSSMPETASSRTCRRSFGMVNAIAGMTTAGRAQGSIGAVTLGGAVTAGAGHPDFTVGITRGRPSIRGEGARRPASRKHRTEARYAARAAPEVEAPKATNRSGRIRIQSSVRNARGARFERAKMKARECIVELAKELAAQSRNRVHTHESELHAAEQHVAELIAKLSASKLEHSRSAQFEPERGGKLQCPRC